MLNSLVRRDTVYKQF